MAKKKTKAEEPPAEVKGKSKKKGNQKETEAAEKDDPKKPLRGLAIGENFGWTGKLPATLLHEHCQKQKWNKVIFDMKKTPKGFIGIVNLSWENPKTKEIIHVKMIPDSDLYQPKETTNEARHFVATYALHRLNYMKNMKMLFPIIFRNYWSDLESKRVQILKENKDHHNNIYNSDPFTVVLQQREKKDQMEKARAIKEQNDAKTKKPMINILANKPSASNASQKEGSIEKQKSLSSKPQIDRTTPTFPRKVWDNAPFIDFNSEIRTSIEESIRSHIKWFTENENPSSEKKEYFNQLFKLGFRESHIQESFKYTSTFVDALEWLIFHIPEDDLPQFFSKRDEDSGVALKISKNIQHEYLLKRLAQSGFDEDEVVTTLMECNGDEIETAVKLTHKLCTYDMSFDDVEDGDELWDQEIQGIDAIESHKVNTESNCGRVILVQLKPQNIAPDLLNLRLYRPKNYPNELPGIQIIVTNTSFKLANYIKLSILKQLLDYLINNNFLGTCIIYPVIEWLEENISRIIEKPGPLVNDKLVSSPNTSQANISSNQRSKTNSKAKTYRLLEDDIERLRISYQEKSALSKMTELKEKRAGLPAWKKKDQLVSVINANKVTVVTGETGSGKSTQIVQFILDDLNSKGNFESSIICTQPRRISTIGLAERISDERLEKIGNEVGYVIRGENKTNFSTRISFVTTGVLLRMLQSFLSSNTNEASIFDKLEYIFIDEVHERSVDSDFLLIILKKIMKRFKNLKIILMSATINTDIFKNFFGTNVNHIHIEGRTFPIKDFYLDSILESLDYTITNNDGESIRPKADSHFFKSGNLNYELIAELCLNIDEDLTSTSNNGSILIFLPGIMEINQCIRTIEKIFKEENKRVWTLPLHSALSSNDQKRVFRDPPKLTRKIVVSTNVAETSITIPDCVAVVDSGRVKSTFYDASLNATKLIESWCSQAEIMQRRGRAGRITNGNCYHLYTEETVQTMLKQPVPEIKRSRLESLYLVVKAMGINKVEDFLNGGLDPPDSSSLAKSKYFLNEIGALTATDKLSNLGKYLSYLPTDLQSGKLLIYGCIFGCLETCLILASISSSGSPFINSYEDRDKIKAKKQKYSKKYGDLIGSVIVYQEYEKLRNEGGKLKEFIKENFLSYLTLKDIASTRAQYISILKDQGFVPFSYQLKNESDCFQNLNRNKENFSLISAIITGSFYPNIARVQLPDPKYFQSSAGAVELDADVRQTKFWIRNNDFMNKLHDGQDLTGTLPATRVFIHPSSLLFSNNDTKADNLVLEQFTNEDGSIDMEKARSSYKADLTPLVPGANSNFHRTSFVVYGSSHHTSKLFIRDVTPTTTLSTLLFGGNISYDMSSHVNTGKTSPGLILDGWMPIRTWCKNGVLIKRLRMLVDQTIEQKLANPRHSVKPLDATDSSDDIIAVVNKVLQLSNK